MMGTFYPDGRIALVAGGESYAFRYEVSDGPLVRVTDADGKTSEEKFYINEDVLTDVADDGTIVWTKVSSTSFSDPEGQALRKLIIGSWLLQDGPTFTFAANGKGTLRDADSTVDFVYEVVDGESVDVTADGPTAHNKIYVFGDRMTLVTSENILLLGKVALDAASIPPAAPAATKAAAPKGKFFKDEFETSLDNWSVLLFNGEAGGLFPVIDNGQLVYDAPTSGVEAAALYAPYRYSDVRLDAQVANLGKSDNAVNLFCLYDDSQGWYEFVINSNGRYAVKFGQWKSSTGRAAYETLYDGATYALRQGTNVYSIVCGGGDLSLLINDELVKTAHTEFGLTEGRVGVGATGGKNSPGVLGYDWVQVSAP
jgi:hypothetical protein